RDETVGWSVQGVRPANRPRGRLRQYERWTKARPDWPTELLTVGRELAARARPPLNEESVRVRRRWKFAAQRDDWAERLTADELSGPRLDTLMGDGWLPLLAAADVVSEEVGFAWWQ